MSRWIVVVMGCGLLAAFSPEAASASPSSDNAPVIKADDGPKRPGLPIEGVVTNPDWVSRPSGEDVARFYPRFANLMGLSGRVELRCTVSSLGMMGDCKVGGELPEGLGFGAAAIRMAPLFRMKPMTVDGAPVGGSAVNIPLNFMMESPPPAPDSTPDAGISPKAMALARRLALAARGMSDAAYVDKYVGEVEAAADASDAASDVDESARQAAFDALRSACASEIPRFTSITTATLARTYSEDELAKIVDFAESPAGRLWFSKQGDMQARAKVDFATIWTKIIADTASNFCSHRACAPPRKISVAPP